MQLATKGFLASVIAWGCIWGAPPAEATIHHVPGDYATIQLGVWGASPGDTVEVAPGTYYENVVMADGVLVRSSAGPEFTTIDGLSSNPVVTFDGVLNGALEGFTVTNGFNVFPGAGVRANGSVGRLTGNIITLNFSGNHGGGIGLLDSDFLIEENTISWNYSLGNGAGIYVAGNSSLEIVGNRIEWNSVAITFTNGGGIYLEAGTYASVRENLVWANVADAVAGAGGGIYCASVDAEIIDNTVVENGFATIGLDVNREAGLGAGIYFLNSYATVTNNIVGTVFPGAQLAGEAVYCTGGDPDFSYNDVWNNDAFNSYAEYGGTCPDQTGQNGNISEDPGCCGPLSGDYTLNCDLSPCLGEGIGGSTIGAFDEPGCGSTRTESTTWGKVKRLFR